MHYYAAVAIPWYLLIDPDTLTINLYRLAADQYVKHATATPGQALAFPPPLGLQLDPAILVRGA